MNQQEFKNVLDQIQPNRDLEDRIWKVLEQRKRRRFWNRKTYSVIAVAAAFAIILIPNLLFGNRLSVQLDQGQEKQIEVTADIDMGNAEENQQTEIENSTTQAAAAYDEAAVFDDSFSGAEILSVDAEHGILLVSYWDRQIALQIANAELIADESSSTTEYLLPEPGDQIVNADVIQQEDGSYLAVRIYFTKLHPSKYTATD